MPIITELSGVELEEMRQLSRSLRTVERVPDTDGGAVLHPRFAPFAVERFAPSDHVARFVDHYWLVRWQLEAGVEHRQLVLSHPTVNVSISNDGHRVVGPSLGAIERQLMGSGWTFGVMFRPGGFWPLLGSPVAAIANRELELDDVLHADAPAIVRAGRIAAREGECRGVDNTLSLLLPRVPQPSESSTALAERSRSDRSITRVEQLAGIAGVSVRTLDRRFGAHIGLSPKKVIQRYRLQEAAERAQSTRVDWAATASELGYADQAHLTRDFRAVTGEAPAGYAKAESSRTSSR